MDIASPDVWVVISVAKVAEFHENRGVTKSYDEPFDASRQWVITHNDFGASKAPAGLDLVSSAFTALLLPGSLKMSVIQTCKV